MQIKIEVTGRGPIPRSDLLQFTITAQLDGPIETMTITVMVRNRHDEDANRASALARAMEFAQLFCAQASA